MRRYGRTAALLGIASLLPAVMVTSQHVRADEEGESTYVVLATDAASTDAAIASVQAAGGEVTAVNVEIGRM